MSSTSASTSDPPALRRLASGDESALEAYLCRYADSSMFLRSNLRAAGLSYEGKPYQAVYAASFKNGEIQGVAAHCWNDIVLVQAAESPGLLAAECVRESGRMVDGISGPWWQVLEARAALGLARTPALAEGRDYLYGLDLGKLRIPAAPGQAECRRPLPTELELLVNWRLSYLFATHRRRRSKEVRSECAEEIRRFQAEGAQWVLDVGGQIVAYAAFPGRIPGMVQVGGVWTPPAHRQKGYAKAVVAGALQHARDHEEARRAVLFTSETNVPAQSAYEALGFEMVGEYCLTLFAEPQKAAAG